MKNTIVSFIAGATLATGVATTKDIVRDVPVEIDKVQVVEPTKEFENTITSKHPYLSQDKTECEKDGGLLSVQVTTKPQNTPTTTESIETITLECLKSR